MEIYRMKKSLFALAATTAFAGAAQAQSSVTVYGILDMGYVGANTRTVAAAGGVVKATQNSFGQSQQQTSRLGFRGTEDLGGGSSAFFTIEMGLAPQNANLSGSTTATDAYQNTTQNAGTALDNRQSFVGLKKNGMGQFAFGRQYTPIFNAGAVTDASQYANVVGNVIYQGSSVGTAAGSGLGAASANGGFTNRASNSLTAKSDKFAGFTVSAQYAMNNVNTTLNPNGTPGATQTTTAGGNVNWNGWGIGADYQWNKLYATAAYQSFNTYYLNSVYSSAANINPGAGATGGYTVTSAALFGAQALTDKQTYAAATYDFGILKAYAQWVGRKIQQNAGTTLIGEQANRTAQQIGVRSFITPTIESWASVGTGKYKGPPLSATASSPSVNFIGWQLGTSYYLSKRTNLYAIYGQQQSSGASPNTVGSGNTANQYALGMRHTF